MISTYDILRFVRTASLIMAAGAAQRQQLHFLHVLCDITITVPQSSLSLLHETEPARLVLRDDRSFLHEIEPARSILRHDHSSCTSRPEAVSCRIYSAAREESIPPFLATVSWRTETTSRPIEVPPQM